MFKQPRWQRQIEEILREKFQGEELADQIRKANELIAIADTVDIPSGDIAEILGLLLKNASKDLRPLAAVYAGFQMGVAYERFQKDHPKAKGT